MSHQGEQRRAARQRVIYAGMIVFHSSNQTMKCHILDLSDSGAKLLPEDIAECPDQFSLVSKVARTRNCEVMWRRDGMIGVRYV